MIRKNKLSMKNYQQRESKSKESLKNQDNEKNFENVDKMENEIDSIKQKKIERRNKIP